MKMNFSGKEYLLKVLANLSTQVTAENQLSNATDDLRAGLMLHGSTGDDAMTHYLNTAWSSDQDTDGNVVVQGVGLQSSGSRIAELFFKHLYDNDAVKQAVLQQQNGLSEQDFETMGFLIYQLLSACEMHTQLQSVENQGDIDVEYWTPKIVRKLALYFQEQQDTSN